MWDSGPRRCVRGGENPLLSLGTMARRPGWRQLTRWAKSSAQNALEVARLGRLGPAYGAPFEVVDRDAVMRLRRYGDGAGGGADSNGSAASRIEAPLVLVPPLMLTAEIYDVSPDLSAVTALARWGADVWVVDFGAPEVEEGGMSRTLDDHVKAVSRAVDRVRAVAGRDVHLAGYSQGGMFAYQAAAYRRSDGIASVITFGSPVDIHRNVPSMRREATALLIRALQPLVAVPLDRIEGLPGILTSTGFKLLTPRKEIEQLVDFVKKLHDRQALEKRERRRRFLGGEGFVAWPGPALRTFVDEFIVHNRMLSGGFVIDGRTVTLADITCPVLSFVGGRDDVARPAAVRAIRKAAPSADVHEAVIEAGHFGLVVGSRALGESWPTVIDWMRWREGKGERPLRLVAHEAPHAPGRSIPPTDEPAEAAFEVDVDFDLAWDVVAGAIGNAWTRLGEKVKDASDALDGLRWQLPRLTELERIEPDTLVSAGRSLAKQAAAMPDATFFLWKGRAFSYRDADTRVNNVVRGLLACGVTPGDRVAVLMEGRPSFLSMVTALNRLGAIAVLVPPATAGAALERALAASTARFVATDPENAARARAAFANARGEGDGKLLVLGGGGEARDLGAGVVDMEAIDPDEVKLPASYAPDPGRARDLALVLLTSGPGDEPRLAPITNHRWAFSALGAAAACTLTPNDTVYCCLPLHHPAGILVSVGGALVGGARLALASRFAPDLFWSEVRRYGATVAFYAGEMARALVAAPPAPHERDHPLRLFAGSGMRPILWRELSLRFGVGVLEFYASTTQNLVLANASGQKVGALGRPLPGSAELALARYDLDAGALARDAAGRLVRCGVDEPGLVLGRLDAGADSGADDERVMQGAFAEGDRWYASGDVLRRDVDGDYWFVDRVGSLVRTASGVVSPRRVEDALHRLPEIALAAVYGLPAADGVAVVATVTTRGPLEPGRLAEAVAELAPHERPAAVRIVPEIPMTDGHRPVLGALRRDGLAPTPGVVVLRYQPERAAYHV